MSTQLEPELKLPVEFEMLDRSLGRVVEIWADRDPDRVCITQDDGTDVTYRELDLRASAIAAGLRDLGVESGDRVATLIANDLRAIYLAIGIAKLGAIEVPMNTAVVGEGLRHRLSDATPTAVAVLPQRREEVVAMLSGENMPAIIDFRPHGDPEPEAQAGPSVGVWLEQIGERVPTEIDSTQPAVIMYTSGTTGLPKGALLTHHYTYVVSIMAAKGFQLTEGDSLMTVLPLFHAGGRYMNLGACLITGARCVLVRKFSVSSFWETANRLGATIMHALVSVAHFLLSREPSAKDREHSIRRGWVAPLPQPIADQLQERFGISTFQGYGMTEAGLPVINFDGPTEACGKVVSPYRVWVVDEFDRVLPPGETGEIVVAADVPWATSSGYWGQPEKTVETFRNFGVHTGDAGYFDEDENLWFVERLKDMIRRRGENISAQTVEVVINELDEVVESAAYAVPSEFGEEDIALAVVVKPGTELSAERLVETCRERLPRYAVPRYVKFIDELPKTETAKVQKFQLKRQGTEGAIEIPEVR